MLKGRLLILFLQSRIRNFLYMDFHSLLEQYKPLLKRHLFPITLGIFGLIFFSYGLISLLASSKTSSKDIIFEAGSDSSNSETASVSGVNVKNIELVVDIEGAVVAPGVYRLPLGARVKDALISASGLSAQADRSWITKNLNLAAKLFDGEKIYIPKIGDNISNSINISNYDGKININSASKEELDSLPGVGPVTAGKIIKLRPYSDVNDLLSKKAVTSRVFEGIKEKITAN